MNQSQTTIPLITATTAVTTSVPATSTIPRANYAGQDLSNRDFADANLTGAILGMRFLGNGTNLTRANLTR
ncbi:MAG: pentapeptide repeat-containing protein, partial [Actinomycetota bacterium]